MDPWHRLFAISEASAEEKAWRQRHEREQASLPSQHHSIASDDATDTHFLDWFCGILPGDGQLSQKIVCRRRGFIGEPLAS
jgi:hypothetical protein